MMNMEVGQNRYQEFSRPDQRNYDNYSRYSPDKTDQRGEKERTRDRERRRERRRKEREHDRDRDRERDRDYRKEDDRERSRDRHRWRESRHGDGMEDRGRGSRSGSQEMEEDGVSYDYGEGFYEEGGYIDHPTHGTSHGDNSTNRYPRDSGRDHRDSSKDRDRDRDRGGDRWMTDTPTNTVLLRGLPASLDEKDIKAELMLFGAPVKDVRLMKRKDTGASRGFAFVEFQNLADAQRWMDQNQGHVLLLNQYRVKMYFSSPRTPRAGDPPPPGSSNQLQDWLRTDWTCSKCGYHNFRRREHCFKCSTTKEESDRAKEGDGFDQVGNNPCNTLIFRGLDALTTEENIVTALSKLTGNPVKNMKVLRDELTGTSRGFGFAEFNTLAESSEMLDLVQSLTTPFEVDGKAIIVSYAKNTYSTILATMSSWSQTTPTTYDYSQFTGQSPYYDSTTGQYYDPTTGQYCDHSKYYAQQQAANGSVTQTQTDSTNAAAAVAQAAIQQAQAAKHYSKQDALKLAETKPAPTSPTDQTTAQWTTTTTTTSTTGTEYAQYPTPDVSTYQFDETSGYYYDPTTGLYYDANSQYYYNSTTNQFMYWDGEKQTYLPAPNQDQAASAANERRDDDKNKKDKEMPTGTGKKDKVKVAKKIAKDMAKWAKTLNAQKELVRDGFKRALTPGALKLEKESASADAGFTILEKVKVERPASTDIIKSEDQQLMPPPPLPGGAKPGLVASYGGDSDDEESPLEDGLTSEDKLLDWSKMACLLCKRQFPNKEALQRHQTLSDLHKKNLESLKKNKSEETATGLSYRDRAKERRAKYGRPDPPVPKKQPENQAPIPFEQPTKSGITEENVGNKLLQKMGWSQGQGLGKANQGRTKVVEASFRQQQAGLGARGSSYDISPGDNYKDNVKRMMQVRYNEDDYTE